jgi:hypothetical protein
MLFQGVDSPSPQHSAPAAIVTQDDISDCSLEKGLQNSANLPKHRQQPNAVDVAMMKFEQLRFRLARLGKSRSLHEVFETTRHFYYPQRLWIAFSVANVGAVFMFAVYMHGIRYVCIELTSFRIQLMSLLAKIGGFLGAAPQYLDLMMKNLNSLQGFTGGLGVISLVYCSSYHVYIGSAAEAIDDTGLPAGVSAYLQQAANSANTASDQVICLYLFTATHPMPLTSCIIGTGRCPVCYFSQANAKHHRQSIARCHELCFYCKQQF